MSENKKTQVVVIGAGPAGYVCAIRLAQLGKKVIVVEKAEAGGVCLNRGCIPSKALIYAGSLYEKMHHSTEMGFTVQGVQVDMKQLQKWKNSVVSKLTGGVSGLLKANGCEVIAGEARFLGPRQLKVADTTIDFEQCVVATGSRPTPLKGFDVDQKTVLDSTGALSQDSLPQSLVCIGGGYIGLELGMFYAKMGVEVTVVEAGPQLLGIMDRDLVRVVEKKMKALKMKVLTGTFVKGMKKSKSGCEVEVETDGKKSTLSTQKVIVTIGRIPNTDSLDLEKAGLKTDSHGFLRVGPTRMTDIPGIYAIGDVAGQPLLAHKGSKEGIVAAESIAGKSTVYDVAAIPAVIFTDPEIASVGLSESEAKQQGYDVQVGTFPFAANGRALSVTEPEGMVKMVADRPSGRLLGVHIVGVEASNLIAEASLALEMGATVEDIASTVHAHPTLPETLMEAAEATLGHAIHIFQRKKPTASPQASL